jgi:hypothetical protein
MTLAARREALELAERAHALVQANPFRAHTHTERPLAEARVSRDVEAQVAAQRGLGMPAPG